MGDVQVGFGVQVVILVEMLDVDVQVEDQVVVQVEDRVWCSGW